VRSRTAPLGNLLLFQLIERLPLRGASTTKTVDRGRLLLDGKFNGAVLLRVDGVDLFLGGERFIDETFGSVRTGLEASSLKRLGQQSDGEARRHVDLEVLRVSLCDLAQPLAW
jgi:hypothetical protein